MKARGRIVAAAALLGCALAPARTRASIDLEGHGEAPTKTYRSPQRFAFELRFGPYRPDVDSEFDGARAPYQDYFGSGSKLLTQLEIDYELFHGFGTAGIGISGGFFQVSGPSPVAMMAGQLSGDSSTLRVLPFAVSAVYRFDYLLERRGIPLVPYGKVGVDYAYWQITDGNGEIAMDNAGGRARGGTPGWHAAVGLALVLDFFDPEAAREFDSDMGVNHTALVGELSHADISGLGQSGKLHLGDTTWSLGVLVEF